MAMEDQTKGVFNGMAKLGDQCIDSIWILGFLLWRSSCSGNGDYCEEDPKESHKPQWQQRHIWNDKALPNMGRWAGDKIALVGDYTDLTKDEINEFKEAGYDLTNPKTGKPIEREWKLISINFTEISPIIAEEVSKFGKFFFPNREPKRRCAVIL